MKKKEKDTKDAGARAREAELIRSQLDDLGLPPSDIQGPLDALRTFETEGVGATRTWKVPAFGVAVTVLLSTQPHIVSYAKVGRLTPLAQLPKRR